MSLVEITAGMKSLAMGSHTTVAASDTVATGLRKVVGAFAVLSSDPIAANAFATVVIPDQIAGPGNITIKCWKPTAQGDTIPVAASTHSKVVLWFAIGE